MALLEILQEQSTWTYQIMQASTKLGEMIREDALTSCNLAVIQRNVDLANAANPQVPQIPLNITSFQGAKLEKEYGADWMWSFGKKYFLVQAKRLDPIRQIGLVSYTIDVPQLKILITASEMLSNNISDELRAEIKVQPIYVFYNTFVKFPPQQIGCTFMLAQGLQEIIREKLDQETVTLPFKAVLSSSQPWYNMFSERLPS